MLFRISLICFVFFVPRSSSAYNFNRSPGTSVHLEIKGNEFNKCMEPVQEKVLENLIAESADQLCYIYTKSGFTECIQRYLNAIKPYLHQYEQYVPDFILNGLKGSGKKACDLEKTKNVQPLITKLFEDYSFEHCLTDTNIYNMYKNKYTQKRRYYKQANICSDIGIVYNCMNNTIGIDDSREDYMELLDILFGSYLDWCRDHKNSAKPATEFQMGMLLYLITLGSIFYHVLT